MTEVVTIKRDGTVCRIAPRLGGAILSCEVMGRPMFRPTPDNPSDVLQAACFTLVPFANRIAHGRLEFGGRVLHLPGDPEAPPHALHGHGWRKAWTVVASTADELELAYEHFPDAWPWHYRAVQRIEATSAGLRISLAVENRSTSAMPFGAGLHPFFARAKGSFIETAAHQAQALDASGRLLPPVAWRSGAVALSSVGPTDAFLPTEQSTARAGDSEHAVAITASRVAGWQFYAPRSGGFFCLEPVSHAPGAFEDTDILASKAICLSRWKIEMRSNRS